jgi:hypothetical protein
VSKLDLSLLTLLAAAGPLAALAQPSSNASRPCTEIETDAERLACYDRALRPGSPAAETPAPATAAPATPASAARAARPESRRALRNTVAPTAAAPPAPVAAPAAPAATPSAAEAPIAILVVGVRELRGRDAVFTTDSGEIWLQTDGQNVRFPQTPFRAEIKPGALNSYFLVPVDGGRAIRVHRGD